jgi:predicted nicotinamide N-methyase
MELGYPLGTEPLILQEIPEHIASGAPDVNRPGPGTGSRTWESSIAMGMFFARHPELLHGRCIELGSGIGLGGILSYLLRRSSADVEQFSSLTLTDYQEHVLDQCRKNIEKMCGKGAASINVVKLDWYDFLYESKQSEPWKGKFDTVIACDCAYLYADIAALAKTLKSLLQRNQRSRGIIWGPNNRGGLHSLIQLLQEPCFHVVVREIEMKRYRLDASLQDSDALPISDFLDATTMEGRMQQESEVFSQTSSLYLFVTLSRQQESRNEADEVMHMADID